MQLPAFNVLDLERSDQNIINLFPTNFIRFRTNNFYSTLGVVVQHEKSFEIYEFEDDVKFIGEINVNSDNSLYRQFLDPNIPYFFICERTSTSTNIHVYSKMGINFDKPLYIMKISKIIEDIQFNKNYTILTTKDSSLLYQNVFNGTKFEMNLIQDFNFSGSITMQQNYFAVHSLEDNSSYLVYPSQDVVLEKTYMTLYDSSEVSMGIISEGKTNSFYFKRKNYLPQVFEELNFSYTKEYTTSSSVPIFIFGFSNDVMLFSPEDSSEIEIYKMIGETIPITHSSFYNNILLLYNGKRILLYQLLTIKDTLQSFTKTQKRSDLIQPTRIIYRQEKLIDIKTGSQRQKELDNGQTPYYYPNVLFEDVD
jgi:hypothetical protein